jgi:7-cyano-7-deazaguanine synthase
MTEISFPLADLAGRPVILLLSGGLDSATCLALAARAGARVLALTIDYNQRHRRELEAATRLAEQYRVARHIILPLDLRGFGGSALTADIAVPKEGVQPGIPITYVPARNTIFLSAALGWAEAEGASDLLIGVNALDYSGYPDCRPAFLESFEAMANLATKAGVEGSARYRVHAPLMALTKAGIVEAAAAAGLDMALTWSCYDPTPAGLHCGRCDSCRLRQKGFAEAGIADPTTYAAAP